MKPAPPAILRMFGWAVNQSAQFWLPGSTQDRLSYSVSGRNYRVDAHHTPRHAGTDAAKVALAARTRAAAANIVGS